MPPLMLTEGKEQEREQAIGRRFCNKSECH